MQRRFNYTDRRRIHKNDLSFSIAEDDQERPLFYADLNLSDYDLPADGKLWIEAYDRNGFMRFPFGSVAEPKAEAPTVLTDFEGSDSYYFRVKVVDGEHRSKLLAVADSVSPVRQDDEQTGKSLLRVSTRPLGPIPWLLEYPSAADHPLLVINNEIDAGKSLARSNNLFQALVMPAILEQVLRRILLEDEEYKPSAEPDPDDMWKEGWLEFAGSLPGSTKLPIDQELSVEDRQQWIETAREAFCREINALRKVRYELGELD